MFRKTCQYYNEVIKNTVGISCSIIPYSDSKFFVKDKKTVIIISGHGTKEGLILNISDKEIYKWKDLMDNLKTTIMIIDSCFSGYAQDYRNSNVDFLITSTYKEYSWNILDVDNNNDNVLVSSLAVTFRCRYDPNYICPIRSPLPFLNNNCKSLSINECQLELIIKDLSRCSIPNFDNNDYPSIGTCIINNMPCSYILN